MVLLIDHPMLFRPRQVQGLLVTPSGIVHTHGVLLLVHLLAHLLHTLHRWLIMLLLLLLIMLLLRMLLLLLLLRRLHVGYVKLLVAKIWSVKCLFSHVVSVGLEVVGLGYA